MFFKNLVKSGWLHAMFIAVVAYPLGSMTQKLVASYTDSNILVYTVLFMLSASVTLLIIAGPGELANKTLRRPETWIYAVLQIFSYILFLLSVKYVSATEGAALGKMGGLFILVLSVMFLHQKINKYEIIGGLTILCGFYMIIDNAPLSLEIKAILVAVVVARALVQCGQKMITEIHKTNRKAKDFKSQIRVTGFVMAVASFVFLLFLLAMALVKSNYDISFLKTFPAYADFIDFKAFMFAIFLGVFVVSVSKYCEFYAGKSIGAKYLTSITSLEIIFIYLLEFALSNLNLIEQKSVDYRVISALALVLLGNVVISLAGFMKDVSFIKKGEKRDTLRNMEHNFVEDEEDFDIVKVNLSSILALYNQDITKVVEELGIKRMKLENILNYEFEDMKLEVKIAKQINNFASMNVSLKDKLTKAYNRYYLEQKAEHFFAENIDFKLYYLDLNKFKPVNDIYSHQAGDDILVKLVRRLKKLVEKKDLVVRLGGDEFVIVQLNNLDKNLSNDILNTIEKPFVNVKDAENDEIFISTAIGRCSSKDFENLETMLNTADEQMYKNKDER
ncbi:MAG: diguanylate cyclase [Proteobacteria bacterium]|nr:diguanylate cyclase [Pseudomonadota bacterium]